MIRNLIFAAIAAIGLSAVMPSQAKARGGYWDCFAELRMAKPDWQAEKVCEARWGLPGARRHGHGRPVAHSRVHYHRGVPCVRRHGVRVRQGYRRHVVRKWHRRSIRIERRIWHGKRVNGRYVCVSGNCPPPPWD